MERTTFNPKRMQVNNPTQDQIKEKSEAEIVSELEKQASVFLKDFTLGVEVCGDPEIKNPNCPGNFAFIKVHAGTTSGLIDKFRDTYDAATIVKQDGMVAATVVDGYGPLATSDNSKIYSARITAAALHTVTHAVLEKGLTGDELQRYFYEKVKLLDKEEAFVGREAQKKSREVMFGGVVLYFNKRGDKKIFVYGLGSVAVASCTYDSKVSTHHFQVAQPLTNDYLDIRQNETFLPTLRAKPNEAVDIKQFVTAQVSDVPKFMQIMTGCDAFYKAELVESSFGPPKQLWRISKFPEPNNLNSDEFFKLPLNVRGDDVLHLSIDVWQAFDALPDSYASK